VKSLDRAEESRAINEIVDRLVRQFPDVPTDDVADVVQQAQPEFEQAPIRDFVPLFVERTAKQRLRQAAG
jgi:hypothetical protein